MQAACSAIIHRCTEYPDSSVAREQGSLQHLDLCALPCPSWLGLALPFACLDWRGPAAGSAGGVWYPDK